MVKGTHTHNENTKQTTNRTETNRNPNGTNRLMN